MNKLTYKVMKKDEQNDRGFRKYDEPCGRREEVGKSIETARMELISNLPGEVFYN